MERYNVLFSGKILSDQDAAGARRKIGALLRLGEDKLSALFSGKTIVLKRGADAETAGRIRAAMRKAGAIVQIVPTEDPSQAPQPRAAAPYSPPSVADAPGSIAIPAPQTDFDLSDCRQPITPVAIPDTSRIQADGDYDVLDPSPPPAPPLIRTDHLDARQADLSDCAQPVQAKPIPDISHLRIDGE